MSRNGTFSSSGISALVSRSRGVLTMENIGKPFTTYVEEKVMERDLNRSLTGENNSRPTAWGTLVERVAFNKLGMNYRLVSKTRYYHKDYKSYWSGMPDLLAEEVVGDIKCPWTLKSFCQLVESMNKGWESLKETHPDYYWQLVSNAILCNKGKALLIVYVPYFTDLPEIRREASDNLDPRFAFINWATDDELPFLIEGAKYNDINAMEFTVPQADIDFLTGRVAMGVKIIKNNCEKIVV